MVIDIRAVNNMLILNFHVSESQSGVIFDKLVGIPTSSL